MECKEAEQDMWCEHCGECILAGEYVYYVGDKHYCSETCAEASEDD